MGAVRTDTAHTVLFLWIYRKSELSSSANLVPFTKIEIQFKNIK